MYHKGNPPSDGCHDSEDPDLPVPSMRECGHHPEQTESIRKPAISLQGLWAYGVLKPKMRYTEVQKESILQAYQERVSLRGLHQLYRVSIGADRRPRSRSEAGTAFGSALLPG